MQRKIKAQLRADDLADYMRDPGDYPDRTTTVSASECTGLIPTPPQSEAEYRSLQQMHGMEIPPIEETES